MPHMRRISPPNRVRPLTDRWRRKGETVGFVPTMGALHDGHRSLIRYSRKVFDRTVVSVFVNPTQFAPGEDFESYPRTLARDLKVCREEGVDLVFAPSVRDMYPDGLQTLVQTGRIGAIWEGARRPGHFDGVATVVLKLFEIVGPTAAVFGEKDYQQAVVLRRMVRDFNLPLRLVTRPTVREPDGLALSSRNVYLDARSRQEAPSLYKALKWAAEQIHGGRTRVPLLRGRIKTMVEAGGSFALDYVGFCDPVSLESKRTATPPLVILIAAICRRPGDAHGRRFIDNILIRS